MVFTTDALFAAYLQEMDANTISRERIHQRLDDPASSVALPSSRDGSKGDPPSPPPQPPPSPSNEQLVLFAIDEDADMV